MINANNQFSVGGITASTRGDIIGCSSDISIVSYLSCEDYDVNSNIAGLAAHFKDNTVRECCSKGSVSFTMTHDEVEINELYMGGLIGVSSQTEIVNCYYLANQVITGDEIVKDGTPANQNDLINVAFYKNRMLWNSNVWNLTDGAYPTLK